MEYVVSAVIEVSSEKKQASTDAQGLGEYEERIGAVEIVVMGSRSFNSRTRKEEGLELCRSRTTAVIQISYILRPHPGG